MKTRLYTAALFCIMLIAGSTYGQSFSPDYVDGNIYLKVKDSSNVVLEPYNNTIPALNLLITTFGIDSIYHPFRFQDPALQKIYRLEFASVMLVDNLINQLQLLGFVEYAEKVPLMQINQTTYLPNDLLGNQWGLTKIQAPLAWDLARGNSQVIVAVIDNAFSTSHEDLAGVIYTNTGEVPNNFFDDDLNGYIDDVNGYDVADMDGNVNPPAGVAGWEHGTHTAGTAGADTDNGLGISSIGFGITILPIKGSNNAAGGNSLSRAYESIDYAMSAGANVISMSWGSKGTSTTGDVLISLARSRNIVMVAAAGNNGDSIPFYPAANANVLSVGATDIADARSSFSNFGSYIDVMAPGSGIYSCLPDANNSYGNLSGTSMACPLVAGLAGLILSAGTYTESQVKQLIIQGCENIDLLNPGYAGKLGAGRINAYNSLTIAQTSSAQPIQSRLQIFPNPCHDQIQLILPSDMPTEGQLNIRDLAGRSVLYQTIYTNSGPIALDMLAPGLYLAELKIGSTALTERLIVQ